MKKVIYISLTVAFITFAQHQNFNKETELNNFVNNGGKVEELNKNMYRLTYPDGLSRVFNFDDKPTNPDNFYSVDSTIINVWDIDTAKYSNMFTFYQQINLVNTFFYPVFIEDVDSDLLPELYGFGKHSNGTVPPAGPVEIYEKNAEGFYDSIYSYDSTSAFVQGLGDINNNGRKEIFVRTKDTANGKFYKSDQAGTFPTSFDFIFYYHPFFQFNDVTFGDFDANGITDCAFIDEPNIYISVYDKVTNNFETIYNLNSDANTPSGFAINDFDKDSKTELIVTSLNGIIYSIEAESENNYLIDWTGNFPIHNAYLKTATNDIDGNGKPEFWIGGMHFTDGYTLLQCYESSTANDYKVVASIKINGLLTLDTFYLQAYDIDSDGNDELILSVGNYIIVFKFVGNPNEHIYKMFYAKHGESTQPGGKFYPVSVYDLTGDGRKDILLPMRRYIQPNTILLSYILKRNEPTNVIENGNPEDSKITITSYPNPFNSKSIIKFTITQNSNVKLKAFNILGKEVKTLISKNLSPGEHTIHWEGKDESGNDLPSGIYLLNLQTNNFRKTIKTILLK